MIFYVTILLDLFIVLFIFSEFNLFHIYLLLRMSEEISKITRALHVRVYLCERSIRKNIASDFTKIE
jgi:hypothetical protein